VESVCFKSVIQPGRSLFLSKIKIQRLNYLWVFPHKLVNLHRNRRYFVIKLHTWFCLSYFLKTNIKFYCIYQYFMSINSFSNTVSVSRYRYIYKLLTWVTLLNHAESVCFKSVIQSGRSLFLSKKNTSLKLPVGVSPLQLVNLHRNQRYFVIKLHTWFCLSYFLKTNIKFYCIYQYFISINSFFQHRICFPDCQWDKSCDYTCYSQWPVTHFSTFYQFILNMLL
jgi:hypothetical protein